MTELPRESTAAEAIHVGILDVPTDVFLIIFQMMLYEPDRRMDFNHNSRIIRNGQTEDLSLFPLALTCRNLYSRLYDIAIRETHKTAVLHVRKESLLVELCHRMTDSGPKHLTFGGPVSWRPIQREDLTSVAQRHFAAGAFLDVPRVCIIDEFFFKGGILHMVALGDLTTRRHIKLLLDHGASPYTAYSTCEDTGGLLEGRHAAPPFGKFTGHCGSRGVSIDYRSLMPSSFAILTICNGKLSAIVDLLDECDSLWAAYQPDAKDGAGPESSRVNPMHVAVHEGREDVVEYLARRDARLVNSTDPNGRTPLEYAVAGNFTTPSLIKALLDHGADPLRGGHVFHDTILSHFAPHPQPQRESFDFNYDDLDGENGGCLLAILDARALAGARDDEIPAVDPDQQEGGGLIKPASTVQKLFNHIMGIRILMPMRQLRWMAYWPRILNRLPQITILLARGATFEGFMSRHRGQTDHDVPLAFFNAQDELELYAASRDRDFLVTQTPWENVMELIFQVLLDAAAHGRLIPNIRQWQDGWAGDMAQYSEAMSPLYAVLTRNIGKYEEKPSRWQRIRRMVAAGYELDDSRDEVDKLYKIAFVEGSGVLLEFLMFFYPRRSDWRSPENLLIKLWTTLDKGLEARQLYAYSMAASIWSWEKDETDMENLSFNRSMRQCCDAYARDYAWKKGFCTSYAETRPPPGQTGHGSASRHQKDDNDDDNDDEPLVHRLCRLRVSDWWNKQAKIDDNRQRLEEAWEMIMAFLARAGVYLAEEYGGTTGPAILRAGGGTARIFGPDLEDIPCHEDIQIGEVRGSPSQTWYVADDRYWSARQHATRRRGSF